MIRFLVIQLTLFLFSDMKYSTAQPRGELTDNPLVIIHVFLCPDLF